MGDEYAGLEGLDIGCVKHDTGRHVSLYAWANESGTSIYKSLLNQSHEILELPEGHVRFPFSKGHQSIR